MGGGLFTKNQLIGQCHQTKLCHLTSTLMQIITHLEDKVDLKGDDNVMNLCLYKRGRIVL